jgi:hypothetical protein
MKHYFKDNLFLSYSRSDQQFVVGGAAVLIPQPGAKPVVTKNRSVFPAVAVRRTDGTVLYELNEYSTAPTHITANELTTISYDKISSVIYDHFGELTDKAADDQLVNWSLNVPAAFIVNTTGADTASLESGQAGMRKALQWQDLAEAQRLMNKNKVPKEGRIALIEENMYQQLLFSLAATQYKDFSRNVDEVNGKVGRLFGFDIITRSSVVTAARDLDTGLLDVNAYDAEIGATDDVVCLCWQRDVVANATGSINLFNRTNDPLYYGDVNSCSMRAGGRVRRSDNVGMVAIKQGAAGVGA